jgi:hypothetical protein
LPPQREIEGGFRSGRTNLLSSRTWPYPSNVEEAEEVRRHYEAIEEEGRISVGFGRLERYGPRRCYAATSRRRQLGSWTSGAQQGFMQRGSQPMDTRSMSWT